MIAIPKNDSDPFIKFGKVFSLTRGIWKYTGEINDKKPDYEKAEMIGMLAIQIQHYFIYNLIQSSLQDNEVTKYKIYHMNG